MRVILLCAVLLMMNGVAFRSAGQSHDLSDAMKNSASGDQTPVEGTHSHDSHDSHFDECSSDDSDSDSIITGMIVGMLEYFHGVHYDDKEYEWQMPVDAAYVVPLNGNIQGMTRFTTVPFSVEGEHAFFGLYLNGGLVDFKHGSLPARATTSASTFGFGAAWRLYFAKSKKTLSPYLAGSFGWQQLSWSYRNPIVTSGGETILDDRLNGLDTYAGMGVALRRHRRFSMFAEAGFGGMFSFATTDRGFHNDLFDNYAYFSAKAGMSLKF